MSVLVFFTAMSPAMRATAATSPLGIFPSAIMAMTSGRVCRVDDAVATLLVIALSLTSTMCASSRLLRWVSCLF